MVPSKDGGGEGGGGGGGWNSGLKNERTVKEDRGNSVLASVSRRRNSTNWSTIRFLYCTMHNASVPSCKNVQWVQILANAIPDASSILLLFFSISPLICVLGGGGGGSGQSSPPSSFEWVLLPPAEKEESEKEKRTEKRRRPSSSPLDVKYLLLHRTIEKRKRKSQGAF